MEKKISNKILVLSWPIGMLAGVIVYSLFSFIEGLHLAILMLLFATGCFMLALMVYLFNAPKSPDKSFLLTTIAAQIIVWLALTVCCILSFK